jgi:hypothetical protein
MKSKFALLSILVCAGIAGCNPREGSGLTNSWATPEAGNYLVVYDQLGAKKGEVTYIGNGTVTYSERDQDVYELTGRVQTVVFTKEKQGEGGAEDLSIPISAQGVNGRADVEVKFKFMPTPDSMGAYVKQYKKPFDQFYGGELRSSTQTCAISASETLKPEDFSKPFEAALTKCLSETFGKVGVKIDFISSRLTGVPNFGEQFAASRRAIAEKRAAIAALDLEKQRRDKEAAIETTINDKAFERSIKKQELEIKRQLAEKGVSPFATVVGVNAYGAGK